MFKKFCAVLVFCFAIFGCASTGTAPQATRASIPANSKFIKIQIAMSKQQVKDLIGDCQDASDYSSGKQWIPFYFGSDYHHTCQYYKGDGRIYFDSDNKVIDMEYDPSEDGYH